jgi:hypothetical protein
MMVPKQPQQTPNKISPISPRTACATANAMQQVIQDILKFKTLSSRSSPEIMLSSQVFRNLASGKRTSSIRGFFIHFQDFVIFFYILLLQTNWMDGFAPAFSPMTCGIHIRIIFSLTTSRRRRPCCPRVHHRPSRPPWNSAVVRPYGTPTPSVCMEPP